MKTRSKPSSWFAVLWMCIFLIKGLHGAELSVTTPQELFNAIALNPSPDSFFHLSGAISGWMLSNPMIFVSLHQRNYTFSMEVPEGLTSISSAGITAIKVIDCDMLHFQGFRFSGFTSALSIYNSSNIVISNFDVSGLWGTTLVRVHDSEQISIKDSVFIRNNINSTTGLISFTSSSGTMSSTSIANNSNAFANAGLFVDNSLLSVQDSLIFGNVAKYATAAMISSSNVSFISSSIFDNGANAFTSGILVTMKSFVLFANCSIENNAPPGSDLAISNLDNQVSLQSGQI